MYASSPLVAMKAVLIESLMGASGVAKEVSPALPQEDFIEAESLNISLQYEMSNDSLKSYKGDKDEDEGEFLINLIEAPGHTDLIAEATDTLCIADGALVVVDCGEELHPKSVFSLALKERIKPIICLRMPDSLDSEVEMVNMFTRVCSKLSRKLMN
ncbi:hypothetical protein HU200_062441 [Digitaria exilis]|uniref:Tr-type G domain-containing protein n=1 Tax=Digitaria exilis TaxID=1010633 RepID=A0A835A5Q5_9POAL|nr:hypothetical protein HU200_062441 [Digitaria exilis]